MGLHYPAERWGELEQGTARAAGELGCTDVQTCVQQLLSRPLSRRRIEVLASYLTIGETYFFRDQAVFQCLEQLVLPELISARRAGDRRLRIWSAGCSTGEEPYSIAMLLDRLIPDRSEWNISILATDINPVFLQKASRGVYNAWSFREDLHGTRERFFSRTGRARFEIAARIKSMVTFAYLNLAQDAYPSAANNTYAMDIIFCRNVLMYFEAARSRELIGRMSDALLEGGWFFVSAVESPHVVWPQLTEAGIPEVVAYRKVEQPVTADCPGEWSWPASDDCSAVTTAGTLEGAPALPPPIAIDADMEAGAGAQGPPTFPVSPEAEAATLYRQHRYVEAVAKLRDALGRRPDNAGAMMLLARSYANLGRLADAARWCGEAVAADKLNPHVYCLLASIFQERGDLDAAATALKRALYLDQNDALTHFALGNLKRRQGKPEDSDRHFRNALSILNRCADDELLAESEGITAGRLAEIIRSTVAQI